MFQAKQIVRLASYAAAAYEDEHVEGELIEAGDVQAVLWQDGSKVVLAFRGTEVSELADVLVDLDVRRERDGAGTVHAGFLRAYEQIEEALIDRLTSIHYDRLYITGHSMGGSLATIAAYRLGCDLCVTFGSPRVGDRKWARGFNNKLIGRAYRVVNNVDIVSRVPSFLRFRHVGIPVLLTASGLWIQPGIITRMLNTVWCLMTGRFGRCHSITEYIRELNK